MCTRTISSVIGWNTVNVLWCRLAQFVFVAVCGAWGVYRVRDRVFFTVCSGDRQLADSEEMFAVFDKKCFGLKNM